MNKIESEIKNSKALTTYEDKFRKKIPLFNEMPCKVLQKEKRKTFKYIFNRIRLKNCASATISRPHSTYYVAYLGNVVTGWAKGDGCIEKPLTTLWRNYTQSSRPDVSMQLTISGGGLKVVTKNHGLTEYWAHRLTTCAAPSNFPRIFCWVYRHEGRRLKHELRCHAVLCSSSDKAAQIEKELKDSLARALNEFKKDKLSRQNARLSLVNSINENPSLPRRKILLSTGSYNYRPPLECSRSAPKLSSIEETFDEEDDDIFNCSRQIYAKILKSLEKANLPLYLGKNFISNNKLSITFTKKETEQYSAKLGNRIHNCLLNENKDVPVRESPLNSSNESSESKPWCDDETFSKPSLIASDNSNNLIEDNTQSSLTTTICDEDLHPSINEEDISTKEIELENKLDLDFKIGGSVLPAIKNLPLIDHKFLKPFVSKAFLEQEQVSLIPVGESQSDFSSLKVYKKKSFSEATKDMHIPCTIFQSGDSVTQSENLERNHIGETRYEDEITTKINSTLVMCDR